MSITADFLASSWPIALVFVMGCVSGAVWMWCRCRHINNRRDAFLQSAVDRIWEKEKP
jgi:hypothetical protein